MVTSVFDETWSELILATRRIFLYVAKKKKSACGIRASLQNEVLTFKTHILHIKTHFIRTKKKTACGIRASLKKRSFDIKNTSYTEKHILQTGLRHQGKLKKNGVLAFKTHFTPKNAFYKNKKKSACGIKTGLKKRSFNIQNALHTQKRILACGIRPSLKQTKF